MDFLEYLDELADHVRTRVDDETRVTTTGSGIRRRVEVTPSNKQACGFAAFFQDEDEMTIAFGEMSVFDLADDDYEEMHFSCREVVDAIIAGRVSETVFLRGASPVRAVARVELPDRIVKVHTRQGLSIFARRGKTRHFEPYLTA
ncbi:hypothetical protein [Micromonospora sp. WMMD714]|uniref:hypothetical protein n=1 Tax=Micromonospora sp. WMMD714 TaxID=3016097 RepID=UPI00249C8590|nr:hypothetical protein [Micromonospora sp. WMMD714]WFE62847.1 hypothetical protein O7625_05895 [Micromonospora sp. WMMD714]